MFVEDPTTFTVMGLPENSGIIRSSPIVQSASAPLPLYLKVDHVTYDTIQLGISSFVSFPFYLGPAQVEQNSAYLARGTWHSKQVYKLMFPEFVQ